VGYNISDWVNFGVAMAGVAGALTGLLFVAVSVRSSALSTSPNLRFRAAQPLVLFTTATVVAIALVAPQLDVPLGLELLGWAAVSAILMLVLDQRAGHGTEEKATRFVERFSPNFATSILLAIAGATFLAKTGGGLYWLLPTVAASLFGGLISAWLFLVPVN
jgi:modulator of FtsH protease